MHRLDFRKSLLVTISWVHSFGKRILFMRMGLWGNSKFTITGSWVSSSEDLSTVTFFTLAAKRGCKMAVSGVVAFLQVNGISVFLRLRYTS